jgi:hypothetical protein
MLPSDCSSRVLGSSPFFLPFGLNFGFLDSMVNRCLLSPRVGWRCSGSRAARSAFAAIADQKGSRFLECEFSV